MVESGAGFLADGDAVKVAAQERCLVDPQSILAIPFFLPLTLAGVIGFKGMKIQQFMDSRPAHRDRDGQPARRSAGRR